MIVITRNKNAIYLKQKLDNEDYYPERALIISDGIKQKFIDALKKTEEHNETEKIIPDKSPVYRRLKECNKAIIWRAVRGREVPYITIPVVKMEELAKCIEENNSKDEFYFDENNEDKGLDEWNNINILETIENWVNNSGNDDKPFPGNKKLNLSDDGFPLNVIFSGPPGTGKTYAAKELLKGIHEDHQKTVCFHPAMAYEDFVRAMEYDGNGFNSVNKVFGQICDKALGDPDNLYAILIDEINRANLPAVLGELMSALEYRGHPYHVANEVDAIKNKRESDQLVVPKNLLIIGTMNTADRSTGILDYALRRRFAFFHFKPNLKVVSDNAANDTFKKVLELFYEVPTNNSGKSSYLAPDIEPNDVAIGHSYFLKDDWELRVKYQVAPILEEYLRDGVFLNNDTSKDAVQAVINEIRNPKEENSDEENA